MKQVLFDLLGRCNRLTHILDLTVPELNIKTGILSESQ